MRCSDRWGGQLDRYRSSYPCFSALFWIIDPTSSTNEACFSHLVNLWKSCGLIHILLSGSGCGSQHAAPPLCQEGLYCRWHGRALPNAPLSPLCPLPSPLSSLCPLPSSLPSGILETPSCLEASLKTSCQKLLSEAAHLSVCLSEAATPPVPKPSPKPAAKARFASGLLFGGSLPGFFKDHKDGLNSGILVSSLVQRTAQNSGAEGWGLGSQVLRTV